MPEKQFNLTVRVNGYLSTGSAQEHHQGPPTLKMEAASQGNINACFCHMSIVTHLTGVQVDKLLVINPQFFASILWTVVVAESEQPRSLGVCQSLWHGYGPSQLSASQSSDGGHEQDACSWG